MLLLLLLFLKKKKFEALPQSLRISEGQRWERGSPVPHPPHPHHQQLLVVRDDCIVTTTGLPMDKILGEWALINLHFHPIARKMPENLKFYS